MRRGFKSRAEQIAVDWRRASGLKDVDPLPAEQLARNLNITLLTPTDIPDMSVDDLEQLLERDPASWSAVTLNTDAGIWIIHNSSHTYPRQQSNLMHEIAHVLCNHKPIRLLTMIRPSIALREYDDEAEEEASWLGACLQLPRIALCWALRCRMNNSDIANYYGASLEQVQYRRRLTGVDRQFAHLSASS